MSDPAPPKGPELHAADARGLAQHVAGALLAAPTGNDLPEPEAPEPPPGPASEALDVAAARRRVAELEGLILAMDAAHAAFEAAPSPAHELTCALAYAALVEEAARINARSHTAAPQRGPGGAA